MVKFDLAAMAARKTNRRSSIVLPSIATTQTQASSLASIYLRVVNGWSEGTDRIITSYEATLGELTTDSPADTAGAVESVNAQIQRLILTLTPDLRDWALRTETVHRGKWIRNIYSAVSVAIADLIGPDDVSETIEAFLVRNVSLVRDVSDQARARIADTVFRGFQRRAPAREVAKEIREAVGLARARSIRIAAHQSVNLGQRLNDERRRQAGIETWKWNHSGKKYPRKEHLERDGKVYTDKSAPEDLPGELPNCGCTGQAVLVLGDG